MRCSCIEVDTSLEIEPFEGHLMLLRESRMCTITAATHNHIDMLVKQSRGTICLFGEADNPACETTSLPTFLPVTGERSTEACNSDKIPVAVVCSRKNGNRHKRVYHEQGRSKSFHSVSYLVLLVPEILPLHTGTLVRP
jgi:hypothetical protein